MDTTRETAALAIAGLVSGQNVEQYSQYLIAFSESEAAWTVLLDLLQTANPDIQLFSLTMLYRKTGAPELSTLGF